jgi:hypothetical protein
MHQTIPRSSNQIIFYNKFLNFIFTKNCFLQIYKIFLRTTDSTHSINIVVSYWILSKPPGDEVHCPVSTQSRIARNIQQNRWPEQTLQVHVGPCHDPHTWCGSRLTLYASIALHQILCVFRVTHNDHHVGLMDTHNHYKISPPKIHEKCPLNRSLYWRLNIFAMDRLLK